MKTLSNKHHLLIFLLVVIALEAIFFSIGNFKSNAEFAKEERRAEQVWKVLGEVPVEAKAVSIYDITTYKEIYGKNQNESLPLASLAKIMTIIIALGEHNLDDVITISQNAIKQDGDKGILFNEKWKVKDLAKLTLIGSLNDGAYAFVEHDDNYLEKMNIKAQKMGMENTLFFNSTGLDIDEDMAGAYSSAFDANIMATSAFLIYPDIFNATIMPELILKSESGFVHKVENTNTILDKIPNILLSKTGYTILAGGNLTVIFKNRNGHNIAVTILGSTFDGRFSDMENLVNALYNLDYATGN